MVLLNDFIALGMAQGEHIFSLKKNRNHLILSDFLDHLDAHILMHLQNVLVYRYNRHLILIHIQNTYCNLIASHHSNTHTEYIL